MNRAQWDDEHCSYGEATATAVMTALQAAGVPATIRQVNETWFGVHVRPKDSALARRLLSAFRAGFRCHAEGGSL